jgi:hypothetical protein
MHPSGVALSDRATASHLTIPAGSVMTLAVINGKSGGRAPQFLVCTDNGPAAGAESPCRVSPQ